MSQSYTNQLIGVISTHPKNQQNQHIFYRSSLDLLGLLLWFQKQSNGCYASTEWLARKLDITTRAVLKTLKKLEDAGLILRTRDGRKRVITCLVDRLPYPKRLKQKKKSSYKLKPIVHSSNSIYIEQEKHNSDADVDVVNALMREGVKAAVARSLAKQYSKQQIKAVINASRKDSSIKSKASWIVAGISKGWNCREYVEAPPKYQLFKRPTEPVDRSGYEAGIGLLKARIASLRKECIR